MNDDKRFAVLIDAENVSDKYVKYIFDELSTDGTVTYKRIYGDWTKPELAAWKNILLGNSITPIQQYGYTSGKNSTDSAIIIDAMDILYAGKVEGFCIVSSDSDFTRLASRLRESGMYVIGMGEKKTPNPFVVACNQFKYLDILAKSDCLNQAAPSVTAEACAAEPPSIEMPVTPKDEVVKAIVSIAHDTSDEDGWSALSRVGDILTKRFPEFDVRNYGFSKLTLFIKSLNKFDTKRVQRNKSNMMYIKKKSAAKKVKAGAGE